jgi:uncharacterized membrane protein YgcG
MPPRYTYWTIIAGGQPTAFRAATREELLPTLKQLQARQPDVVMKWFARGRLWESPEEAAEALRAQRRGEGREKRGPKWRPGGTHEDPRERFKIPREVKRRRLLQRLRREQPQQEGDRPSRPREERSPGPWDERPPRRSDRPHKPSSDRPPRPPQERGSQRGHRSFKPKDGRQRGGGGSRGGAKGRNRGGGGSGGGR